ncbi:hypothetical protein GEMRC1_011142 [Eukaryota sp. GEM-RC1]
MSKSNTCEQYAIKTVHLIGTKVSLSLWWNQLKPLSALNFQRGYSSASERNWSTFGFIHNKLRNDLTPEKANDLVYIRHNLRLLRKNSDIKFRPGYYIDDADAEYSVEF